MSDIDSRTWMSQRAERRAVVDTQDPEFLVLAKQAFEGGDIGRLTGGRQAAALWDIAVRIGLAIDFGPASPERKVEVIRLLPRVLADALADESDQARLFFWDDLLGPAATWATRPAPIRAAIIEALIGQTKSPDRTIRWSAAHGARALPVDVSRAMQAADPEAWNDRDLRAILRMDAPSRRKRT